MFVPRRNQRLFMLDITCVLWFYLNYATATEDSNACPSSCVCQRSNIRDAFVGCTAPIRHNSSLNQLLTQPAPFAGNVSGTLLLVLRGFAAAHVRREDGIALTSWFGYAAKIQIKLEDCLAQKMDSDTLAPLQDYNVMSFELTQSGLQGLTEPHIRPLRNIIQLGLERGHIGHLQPLMFKQMKQLRVLSLAENNVSCLFADNFYGLVSLERLSLDYNALSWLANGTFSHLIKMKYLNLRHNSLSYLHSSAFSGLDNLEHLDLRGNELRGVDELTFEHLRSLQFLLLRGNKLLRLPSQMLARKPNLTMVDASMNHLRKMDLDLCMLSSGSVNTHISLTHTWIELDATQLSAKMLNCSTDFPVSAKRITLDLRKTCYCGPSQEIWVNSLMLRIKGVSEYMTCKSDNTCSSLPSSTFIPVTSCIQPNVSTTSDVATTASTIDLHTTVDSHPTVEPHTTVNGNAVTSTPPNGSSQVHIELVLSVVGLFLCAYIET